jgi:carboxyl-terminal processing protease
MLDDVYDRLTSEYLYRDSLDDILLMRGAIDGMVNVVGDEYTSFFTPGDSEEFQTALGESYSGIGVVVEPSDNGLIVISPFRGSPAMDGGLQPGDVITHVDGVSIMDIGAEAVDLIKGPSNTEVTLTITRDDDSYDKVFMRSAVSFEMVDREQQDDNFVISILSF